MNQPAREASVESGEIPIASYDEQEDQEETMAMQPSQASLSQTQASTQAQSGTQIFEHADYGRVNDHMPERNPWGHGVSLLMCR